MFNSLKDRLNSAVNSGIVPKIEDARKKLSGEEADRSVTSPVLSPTKSDSNADLEGSEEDAKGTGTGKVGLSETGATPDQRASLESGRGEAADETGELSEETKKKLEKLKKYEVKYPGKRAFHSYLTDQSSPRLTGLR